MKLLNFVAIKNRGPVHHGLNKLVRREVSVNGNVVVDQNWRGIDRTIMGVNANFSVSLSLRLRINHLDSAGTQDCRWWRAKFAYVDAAIKIDWRSN